MNTRVHLTLESPCLIMQPPKSTPSNSRNDRDGIRAAPPGYVNGVSGGFPSPTDDYLERDLDLHRYAVQHPACTFFMRVDGPAMIDAGIHPRDILVIDRSLTPQSRSVVIAVLADEFLVRRLIIRGSQRYLAADNPDFHEIDISARDDVQFWGVAIHVLHNLIEGPR